MTRLQVAEELLHSVIYGILLIYYASSKAQVWRLYFLIHCTCSNAISTQSSRSFSIHC